MSPSLSAVFSATHPRPLTVGESRIRLLEAIRDHGSIAAAGRAMGLSYKGAWEAATALNNLFARPLVVARPGGRHGGGAELTAQGLAVITAFRRLEGALAVLAGDLDRALGGSPDTPETGSLLSDNPTAGALDLMRRLSMQTTARNALRGTIAHLIPGTVNTEVVIDLGDARLTAVVTNGSVRSLGLDGGGEVTALIKASFVMLAVGEGALATSADNHLPGTVTARHDGPVNSEISLDIGGGKTLVAIVTRDSAERLELAPGVAASALIEAHHIILALD